MKDKKKRVALVAACDRNNYGDVLLPIIFEEFYAKFGENKATFSYYALSDQDMTNIGGRQTKSIYTEMDKPEIVIIAGGQVLAAQYYQMFLNLQTCRFIIYSFHALHSVTPRTTNSLCRLLLKGKNKLPWTIFPHDNQKIYYNAVGGRKLNSLTPEQIREIDRLISSSFRFSVRDAETYRQIKVFHKEDDVSLLPDTAIEMSILFPRERLEKLISSGTKTTLKHQNYYVIQINKKFGTDEQIGEIVTAVREIYNRKGLHCVLLPIGRAQGHEDDISLKKIKEECGSICIYFDGVNTIYDIMFVIAGAKAFLGTSLHGQITAASYFIPHTVVSQRAEKTLSFVNTWKTTSYILSDDRENIVNFVTNLETENCVLHENIEDMQLKVKHYFFDIIDEIDAEV